jgi:hypothetical protein
MAQAMFRTGTRLARAKPRADAVALRDADASFKNALIFL